MEEQLTSSIDWDCDLSHLNAPEKKSGKQWQDDQIAQLKDQIPRYREQYQEEVERTNNRNEWNRLLMDSLDVVSPALP